MVTLHIVPDPEAKEMMGESTIEKKREEMWAEGAEKKTVG